MPMAGIIIAMPGTMAAFTARCAGCGEAKGAIAAATDPAHPLTGRMLPGFAFEKQGAEGVNTDNRYSASPGI
jgi:hypothetical protein